MLQLHLIDLLWIYCCRLIDSLIELKFNVRHEPKWVILETLFPANLLATTEINLLYNKSQNEYRRQIEPVES